MRFIRFHGLTAAALLGGAFTAAPAATGESRPAVVELFTSEGCSSCPPAEAYVGELVRRRGVLALTYHVDYWDDLGWRDRFGLPEAVRRQRNYARTLRLSSVYTPQVVIDGQGDFVGSDRVSIDRALTRNRSGVAVAVAVRDGEVLVDLGMQADAAPSDVVLVAYQRSAVSPIGRGENAGRTLNEFNVVREFHTLGRWDGHIARYRSRVDALPRGSTDVAVLVQPVGQAPIIGAATVSLQ
jgi:hypothetical protein